MSQLINVHFHRCLTNNQWIVSLLFIFFFHIGYTQQGNYQEQYPNQIEVKPLNLAAGQYNINYERVLNQYFTVEVSYGHWFGVESDNYNVFGNNVALNPRYYFAKNFRAPEKFYAGPYFNYNILTNKSDSGDNDSLKLFEKGVLVGRQWLQENGIVFDLNAGIAHVSRNFDASEEDTEDYEDDIKQFLPKVGAAIGYTF